MNLSNQALFPEGLDNLFDMIAHQNAMSMIKLEEDWLFLLAKREKGCRRKMCGVYRALGLKEQRAGKRKIVLTCSLNYAVKICSTTRTVTTIYNASMYTI